MMEIRERIGEQELVSVVDRFAPTPRPYTLLIRERFNDDGTVDVISRKRIYSSILSSTCTIIDEDLKQEQND